VVFRLHSSLPAVPIIRTALDEKWCHPTVRYGKRAERTAAVLSGTAAVRSAPTRTAVALLRSSSYCMVRAPPGFTGKDV
jgi:hypothetical protein